MNPTRLSAVRTREEYDEWLVDSLEQECWQAYSRNGLKDDRWGYFAKLVNIVVHEIAANRELLAEDDWQRLQPFLHVPIDSTVTHQLSRLDPKFPPMSTLKGMTKVQYLVVQDAVRALALRYGVPSIWFEAASARNPSDSATLSRPNSRRHLPM